MWNFKTENRFFFRNTNQNLRKECAQCTKIKQKVKNFENKKIELKAKQNKEKTIEYKNIRYKTDIDCQIIRYTRNRIYKALKRTSNSSSTSDILGIDINTYGKRIERQMTPNMTWDNTEIDHVQAICLFDVSIDEKLGEPFNWKNTQPLLKQDHQHQGTKYKFLD